MVELRGGAVDRMGGVLMARQRVQLPFGGGLDRYTGPMAVDRSAQEDLRGVHLADGWARVRLGCEEVGAVDDDVIIIAGKPLLVVDEAVLVGYHATSREVRVYRAAADGSDPQELGVWFTLEENDIIADPPRVSMAEVGGLMFLAHDEWYTELRATTHYLDPSDYSLNALTAASFAHAAGIRFRGVESHLDVYLVGWGYGASAEVRPEMFRTSMPGEPTEFHVKHYDVAGEKGSPIVRCVSVGGQLLAFKPTGIWRIFGSDRSTFGVTPVDSIFGLPASRLAIVVDGACYFWSRQNAGTGGGPRRTTGGPSEDLGLPLDLNAPSPADLEAEGAHAYGIAAYYPPEQEVLFIFGARVYAYSLRTGRWRYDELPWTVDAAIMLQPGVDIDIAIPPGYVDTLRVTSSELTIPGFVDSLEVTDDQLAVP